MSAIGQAKPNFNIFSSINVLRKILRDFPYDSFFGIGPLLSALDIALPPTEDVYRTRVH